MNFLSLRRSAPAAIALSCMISADLHAQRPSTAIAPPEPVPAVGAAAAPATPAALPPVPTGDNDKILLNFQGATLTDVLNYLSEAAGFVIVGEVPVSGTVNIVSRQPITGEEAVDLLNSVLIEKGFTAIRNGRILKIVSRTDAPRRDIPVIVGSNPELIPRKDEMVTQILPLRSGEAAKLIENLRPLLPSESSLTANENSNAILMTDTQTNIRRVAQIINALDTSTLNIADINIFPLQFADAKEVASVITQLYASTQTPGNVQQQGGRGGRGGFGGFGGRGGGGAPQTAAQSEARLAATRVVAVADEQSNSVIVSAPDENMKMIRELITQIDTSITDVTQTRIYRLVHADAIELAELISSVYAEVGQSGQGQRGGQQPQWGGRRGGQQQQPQQSGRSLLQSRVTAVGDPRTNSIVVTAAAETMIDISEMVGRLDATDAKKQRVYVYSLEHADADVVANVLRGMLGDTTVTSLQGTSVLTERTTTGAAMDANQNSSGGIGTGGGARAR